jgi:hypothetical protein
VVDANAANEIAIPWLLHTLIAVSGSLILVTLMRSHRVGATIQKLTRQSFHTGAWHEFSHRYFNRWVFVRLVDGRHYYGQLGIVSGDGNQDVVLWYPFPYSEDDETYERTGAEAAYFPAHHIASVMVAQVPKKMQTERMKFGVYNLVTGERIDGESRKQQ